MSTKNISCIHIMNGCSIFFENISFQSELVKTFESFLSNESFTDVTLVTDDLEQFKAHTIILSARSLFFKQLFIKNPQPNPLIFLRGVTKIDLKKMLEFIYLGKVSIEEERKYVYSCTLQTISTLMDSKTVRRNQS